MSLNVRRTVFKLWLMSLAFGACYSKSADVNNIQEFRQYFDIALHTDKTTIKGHSRHVVCMLNSWSHVREGPGKYNIQKNFDGSLCTHLIYRSILLDNQTFGLKPKNYDLDIKLGSFNQTISMKTKYPHLKILLSVGGYDEGIATFSRMAAGRESRQKFIRNATATIKKFGFDGLNLDWEFPEDSDKNRFTSLALETKAEFQKSKLILTTIVSGLVEKTKYVYEVSKICSIFDLVIIMAFDYTGPWNRSTGHNAPLYGSKSVSEILKYLLDEAKVDPQALVLGVPLEGKPFQLQTQNMGSSSGLESKARGGFSGPLLSQRHAWGYNEVCDILKSTHGHKTWKTFWDRSKLVPFTTNGTHWISFDNQDSIFAKVWLAREYNLKGIMAWAIDTDDFNGHCSMVNYPLLRTINYALQINTPEAQKSHWPSLCTLYSSTKNRKIFNNLKPKIMENITRITTAPYQHPSNAVKIKCSAEGNPRPHLRWYKADESREVAEFEVLKPKHNANKKKVSSSSGPMEYNTPAESNCGPHKPLEIVEENELILDESTIGNYFCSADNLFGMDKKSFSLPFEQNPNRGKNPSRKQERRTSVPWGWIVGSLVAVIVVVVNICFIVYCLKKRSNNKQDGLTKQEIKVFFRGASSKRRRTLLNIYQEVGETEIENIPYDSVYEVFRKDYDIDEENILGNGAFGVVFLGKVKGSSVAVKSTKEGAEKQYLVALLSELKILIHLGQHPNIVSLVGASTISLTKGVIYIFVEYCALGNLQTYMRNKCRGNLISLIKGDDWDETLSPSDTADENMITTKDLIIWSYQVAKALQYLTIKKVIHGDLASRNVLLFKKNVIKVTDFGLSRKRYDYADYVKNKQEPLPWRWMAIESLRDLTFSHQSDIWSFGITIWEIFSLGETPYSGISWSTDFVNRLADGLRVHIPKYATTSLYRFMAKCWNENPQDRLKPEDLCHYFSGLIKETFSMDYAGMEEI